MERTITYLVFSLFIFTSCAVNPDLQSPSISILDFVSNPEYNKDCKKIKSSSYPDPIDFLGISPGETTEDGVISALGEPSEVSKSGEETNWFYDNRKDVFFSIIFVNKTATRIDLVNTSKYQPTLLSIVEKYGCPSIIQALDTSEEPNGMYTRFLFSYPENGVEFWFEFGDINLASVPKEIKYFKPKTLSDYIKYWGDSFFVDSPVMKPIDWSAVVIYE